MGRQLGGDRWIDASAELSRLHHGVTEINFESRRMQFISQKDFDVIVYSF